MGLQDVASGTGKSCVRVPGILSPQYTSSGLRMLVTRQDKSTAERPRETRRDCGQDSCAPDGDSLYTWLIAGQGELACVATLKPNLFDACSGVRDLLLALLLQVTNAELGGLRERTSPCALLCRIWFFVSMQGGLLG